MQATIQYIYSVLLSLEVPFLTGTECVSAAAQFPGFPHEAQMEPDSRVLQPLFSATLPTADR